MRFAIVALLGLTLSGFGFAEEAPVTDDQPAAPITAPPAPATLTPPPATYAPPSAPAAPVDLGTHQSRAGMIWHLYPSFNFGDSTNVDTDTYFTVGGGLGMDLMLVKSFGVFGDVQYLRRSFKSGLYSNSAHFFDVAFGLALNLSSQAISLGGARTVLRVGGFAAIPVNTYYTGNLPGTPSSISQATNPFMGIYADLPITWPFVTGLGLGIAPYLKVGVGTMVKEYRLNIRSIEFGANVVLENF